MRLISLCVLFHCTKLASQMHQIVIRGAEIYEDAQSD